MASRLPTVSPSDSSASTPRIAYPIPVVVPPSQAHSLDREAKRVELTKSLSKGWGLSKKQVEETVNRKLAELYGEGN